jgi:peptidoglycan biosynthesis protein MviN/MurJ (putative lipid II flippase)
MAIASALFVVCGLIGAALGGAAGTMYGAAVASWAGAVLFWLQLRHALRDSKGGPAGAPVPAAS